MNIDVDIDEIFNATLKNAKPVFTSSRSIEEILTKSTRLMPNSAKKLYSFVKFCEQRDSMDIPLCVDAIKALKDYERRRVTR